MVALLLTAACSYPVSVPPSPALDVYASYTDKITGKYALYVDATSFTRTVSATGEICSAHNYPINANDAFKASAVKTLEQLVENVEVVDAPIAREALAERGYRGMIVIKSDEYSARLMFVPGFWQATATASADISARILVDGPEGRLFGTSGSASRSYDSSTGSCGGGAEALSHATSMAMKEMFERLGERFANEPKLRHPQPQTATSPSS
ncbi:hypothetical protein ACFPL7_11115 [Dongia soli]|uniref:DUF4410 domain-containing protein n=1 Tax=Dongia soli TaxID=600628 RepID=A0ABU5EBX0_9PROT|nr:hypothetical protein [Dongia soli]MDY0883500.1 hypothetical protein [Dongia soli]